MATTNLLSVYWAVMARVDGVNRRLGGGFSSPFTQTPIEGVPLEGVSRVTVPAGTTKTIYDYTADGSFELFGLWSSGYVTLTITSDTPVSSTNLAASGSNPKSIDLDKSTIHPFVLDSDQVWGNDITANRKIYTVSVRNRNTDDVIISSFLVN